MIIECNLDIVEYCNRRINFYCDVLRYAKKTRSRHIARKNLERMLLLKLKWDNDFNFSEKLNI